MAEQRPLDVGGEGLEALLWLLQEALEGVVKEDEALDDMVDGSERRTGHGSDLAEAPNAYREVVA